MAVPILNTYFIILTSYQLFTIGVISGLPFSSISSISSLGSRNTSSGGKSSATSIIPNDVVTDDDVMAESANFIIITPTDESSQNLSPINCGTGFDNINLVPLSTPSKLNLIASPVYSQSIVESSPIGQSTFIESNQLSFGSDEPYLTLSTSSVLPGSNIVHSMNKNVESATGPLQEPIVPSQPQTLQYQPVEPLNKLEENPKSDFIIFSNAFSSPCQQSSSNVASNFNSQPLLPAQAQSPMKFTLTQPNSIRNSYTNNAADKSSSPNVASTIQSLHKPVISVQPRYEDSVDRYPDIPDELISIGNLLPLKRNSLDPRNNFKAQSNTRTDPVPKSENEMTNVVTAKDFFIVDSSPSTMANSLNNINSYTESKSCNAESENRIIDKGNNKKIYSDQVIYFHNKPKDIPKPVMQTGDSFFYTPELRSDINTERNMNKVTLNTRNFQKVDNNVSSGKVDKENNNVIYIQPQNNNDIKDKPIQKNTPYSNVFLENNVSPIYSQKVKNINLVQPEISASIIQFSNEDNNNLGCPQLKKITGSNDKIYFSNNNLNKMQSSNNNNLMNLKSNYISENNFQDRIKDKTENNVINIQKANNQGCPQLISLPLLNKGGILNKQIVNDHNYISDTPFNFDKNNQFLISNGNNQSPMVSIQNSNLPCLQMSNVASNNVCNKDTIIENNVNNAQTVLPQNKLIIRRNNETALDKILAQKNSYSNLQQTISDNSINQPGNRMDITKTNYGYLQDNNNVMIIQQPEAVSQTPNNPSYSNNLNCLGSFPAFNDNLAPNNIAVSLTNPVNPITSSQISFNQLLPLNAGSTVVATNIIASENTPTVNGLYSSRSLSATNTNSCNDLTGLISGNFITLPSTSLENTPGSLFTFVPSEHKQVNKNNIVLAPSLHPVPNPLNNNEDVVAPSFPLLTLAPSLPIINPKFTNAAPYINQPAISNQNYLPNNNLQALLTILNSNINNNPAATTSTALNGIRASNLTPVQSLPQVSFVNTAPPTITVPPIQVTPSENYISSMFNLPFVGPSSSFPTMQTTFTSPVGPLLSTVLPQNNAIEPRRIYSSLNRIASSLTQNIISKLISKTIPMAVNKLPPVNPTKPVVSEPIKDVRAPHFNPAPPSSNSSPKSKKINVPLRLDTVEPLAPYLNFVPPSSTRLPKSNIPVACNEYLPPLSESQSEEYSCESDPDSFMPFHTSNSYPYIKECSTIFKVNQGTREANKFGRYAESVVL